MNLFTWSFLVFCVKDAFGQSYYGSPAAQTPTSTLSPFISPLPLGELLNLSLIESNGATLKACADIPPWIRILVGCPLFLPVDFSNIFIQGNAATNGNFGPEGQQENEQLFEGDMRVPPVNASTMTRGNTQRGVVIDDSMKWPNGIMPYVIDPAFSSDQQAFIKQSMCNFYKISCVRFKPRSDETDFVKIKSLDGCWSSIGKEGGKQYASIQIDQGVGNSGCLNTGIPEHELMHAFGFIHEQSRTDRDSAVTVMYNNVQSGEAPQFDKYKPNTYDDFGQAYDTSSIMQYDSFAFSVSDNQDKPTMLRLDGSFIADPTTFSAADVVRLNDAYSCTSNTRPDDSSFDMTCSSTDPGTDSSEPDDPTLSKIKGTARFKSRKQRSKIAKKPRSRRNAVRA